MNKNWEKAIYERETVTDTKITGKQELKSFFLPAVNVNQQQFFYFQMIEKEAAMIDFNFVFNYRYVKWKLSCCYEIQ